MHRAVHFVAVIAFCLLLSPVLSASPYTKMIVFGDSLSDCGNAYAVVQYPPAPYYNGRFSNGPIWAEQLAPLIDVPVPTPAVLAGLNATDCAFGGARTTGGLIPSLEMQVAAYCSTATLSASDLCVLWAGANDFLDGQLNPAIPAAVVKNQIALLAAAGARNFLVLNLPPLGQTPRFLGSSRQAAMDMLSMRFNEALADGITVLQPMLPVGTRMVQFDVHGLFTQLLADPEHGGFANVTGSAFLAGPPSSIVPDPDQYLYWDDLHPTQAAHHMLAERIAAVLVPEPAGATLTAAAVSYLLVRRRRAA